MISNFSILKRRYQAQEHSHKTLEAQLHRIETQKNSLDIERNILKPIIKSLQEQKQQQTRFLTQKGYRVSEILAEGADEDGVDDLYATYAMLHTYRSNADDYQRISENIKRKKTKPPPPPPQSQPILLSSNDSMLLSRSPYNRPLPHVPLSNQPTLTDVQIPSLLPLTNDTDSPQLISYTQLQLSSNLPHFQSSSWMRETITREESRELLTGRPDGTFLVRPKPGLSDHMIPVGSEPLHTHTIDIVDEGKFKRIPVFRGPSGGYGFADPFEFDSILSLVCYYATNTMQRHNDSLQNTVLAHPAFLTY
jgi:phosphoinositide-3-kinase regulatory subunit